jgi:hypothetical protein
MLLNRHFINNIFNSNMFQPLKRLRLGVKLIHPSKVDQQNESTRRKFNLLFSVYCVLQQQYD